MRRRILLKENRFLKRFKDDQRGKGWFRMCDWYQGAKKYREGDIIEAYELRKLKELVIDST